MRRTYELMKDWLFTHGGTHETARIGLPHTWNAIDGQDGGGDYWRGECTYEKTFESPRFDPATEEVYLEFDGVSASAKVFVNDFLACTHDGGYSRFRTNITEELVLGDNTLKVQVDNGVNDRVYPQNADFTFYGGIYRPVRLVVVPRVRFDMDTYGGCGIRVTPRVEEDGSARVRVESRTTGGVVQVALENTVLTGEDVTFAVPNPRLWHGRRDPQLYTLCASLYDGAEKTDEQKITFGIRSFTIDPDEGFILNGEDYPLRGVAMHQDFLGKGNAVSEAEIERSVMHVYEMGATTIRLAHYQHAQYTYDLCDRLGLVLWTEIPYISEHLDNARDNARSQMRELIEQNYNHPSIAVWGISNEITMAHGDNPNLVPFHRELNDLIHELDATRPSTMACITMLPTDHELLFVPDTLSYNHYFGWYGGRVEDNGPWFDRLHAMYPDLPVGMSEYGCENSLWHAAHPEPGDYSNEYQMAYHESMIRQLFPRKYLWATHVWNMFDFAADARDEGGTHGRNNKGLVTFDRDYRKDAWYAYRAWLSDEPMLHLCSKEYVNREGDETEFVVYSNLPEVVLSVGDRSYRQSSEDHFFHFTVPQPEGNYLVEARAGGLMEQAGFIHVQEADPAYSFSRKTVLNWFDIETPEGFYSIRDLMRDVMASEEGAAVITAFLERMQALRLQKEALEEPEKEDAREKRARPGEGMNEEEQMAHMVAFSPLQMIRMGAPDMPKEEILEWNRRLNAIPKVQAFD